MYAGLHVQYPIFWSETRIFITYFFQKYQNVKFHLKIRPAGAEQLLRAYGQTDRYDEANNSLFSQILRKCLNSKI